MGKWSVIFILFLTTCCNTPHSAHKVKDKDNYSLNITKQGALSVLAVDLHSNEVIVQHNPQQRMTPASLTKVLTTGAALSLLKPDYSYSTRFYLVNTNDAKKALLIVGSGDPSLGSERFASTKTKVWFEQVAKALLMQEGIHNLDGGIIIDDSCYPGIQHPSKRTWEDMGNYYGAVPHGLSYKENTFRLTLKSPAGVGQPCSIVKTSPKVDVNFNCLVKSAGNHKDSAYIYGNTFMKEWYVSGTIPQGRSAFVIKGALPNPALTMARELKAYLAAKGIKVSDRVTSQKFADVKENKKVIYTHQSPPLLNLASVVNKRSHNLFADHLLFAIADKQQGSAGWDAGVQSLTKFWKNQVPEFSGVFFDGCGLSPFNAVSAADMVKTLTWMHSSECSDEFKQTLSVAGVDGTLKSILKDDAYKGRFIGKSGSLNGVLGYCGYLKTNEGRDIAFCIMANRFTEPFKELRANMEGLMQELINQN